VFTLRKQEAFESRGSRLFARRLAFAGNSANDREKTGTALASPPAETVREEPA
jgi:hypothetical protein